MTKRSRDYIERKFEKLAKDFLDTRIVQEISIEDFSQKIQIELDNSGLGSDLPPIIRSEYDIWSNPETIASHHRNRELPIEAEGTLLTISNTYLNLPEHQQYAAYLRAPDGFLFQDIQRKIDDSTFDLALPNLMLFIISYFHQISKLPLDQQTKYLAQFPEMPVEDYQCAGGSQSRISSILLQFSDPLSQAFNNVVVGTTSELSRLTNVGVQIHLLTLLQRSLGFKPLDDLWHSPVSYIPAEKVWDFVKNFDENLRRKLDKSQEEERTTIMAIADACDEFMSGDDAGNMVKWRSKMAIHSDKLDIKTEDLYGAFFDDSLNLKEKFVNDKLQELAHKFNPQELIKRSVTDEQKLDFNLHDSDAPQKIARVINNPDADPRQKKLAIKALWILSENFPGNSKENFFKTLCAIGRQEIVQDFKTLSDEDIHTALTRTTNPLNGLIRDLAMDPALNDMVFFLESIVQKYINLVNPRQGIEPYPFYDMIQEKRNIPSVREGLSGYHLELYQNPNNEIFLLNFLNNLLHHDRENRADHIFYSPYRWYILEKLSLHFQSLPLVDVPNIQESKISFMRVWNDLFNIAVRKQDVDFLTSVLAIKKDFIVLKDDTIKKAFIDSLQVGNKAIFRILNSLAEVTDELRFKILSDAIDGNKINVVRELINEIPAIVNMSDEAGDTAILFAAKENKESIVDLLIKGGANTDIKDSSGNNIFHISVLSQSDDVIKVLLQDENARKHLNEKNHLGRTPIMLALEKENEEITSLIFEKLTPIEQINALNSLTFGRDNTEIGERLLQIIDDSLTVNQDAYLLPETSVTSDKQEATNKDVLSKGDFIKAIERHKNNIPSADALITKIAKLSTTVEEAKNI